MSRVANARTATVRSPGTEDACSGSDARTRTKNGTTAWTELMYRIGEHYAWEPMWTRPASEFHKVIRRQEPPLNVLFLVLLRLSTPETLRALLEPFGLTGVENVGACQLQPPVDFGYTQPDVCIESETTRVFIELKIDSAIDLQQVQKYVLLHPEFRDGKRLCLCFLTKRTFAKSWSPRQDGIADVHTFLSDKIATAPIDETLAKQVRKDVLARYDSVKREVHYGCATWESIGQSLTSLRNRYEAAGGRDIEARIITDFVDDLSARKLMSVPR